LGRWTRRAFLAGTTATAGVVALAAVGCGGDDDEPADRNDDDGGDKGDEPTPSGGLEVSADGIPTQAAIFGLIEEVFAKGVRRPGYEADIWCEGWIEEKYRALGLENVRQEPVKVRRWEPTEWKLEAIPANGETKELTCFPVPFAEPVDGLEVELAAYDKDNLDAVKGKASLYDLNILKVPADLFVPEDREGRLIDAEGTLTEMQTLPFGGELQEVVDPSVAAGAVAFIGSLQGYPTDTCEYFVPYHARTVEIPGVWINGSDGTWLHEQLAAGAVTIRLSVATTDGEFESHNVVGELPGADDDMVIIGSHHDGPWSSAVEDGSGIALVLAQATYWAAKPQEERPHRLVFLLQGGHMSGGAGLLTFIGDHRDELVNVVLEVHLEHAALESENRDGELVSLDRPVPRWVFTSEIPRLKEAVFDAFTAEKVDRSMILPTDAIGTQPPTDGAFYPVEGVPVVQVLAAPWYLFDSQDTLDKVHQESLVPLTKATVRIIDSTKGVTAAQMRET
jgi:hypothetical protein